MKRYLAFVGSIYYPSGGMDDFKGDFDAQDEAVAKAISAAKERSPHPEDQLWRYTWAHVWDCNERRKVWRNPL